MCKLIKILTSLAVLAALGACTGKNPLAEQIKNNGSFARVDSMGRAILRQGLDAGSGYSSQVWIRDLNTFIETACEEVDPKILRAALVRFFALQQPDYQVVDGYVLKEEFTWDDPCGYYSDVAPEHVGFKNTVETDQETSLIQAITKYIRATGDRSILAEQVAGKSVYERIAGMVDWLMTEKYNADYGLLTGVLTADWGDVQHDPTNIVDITENSVVTIDVYDNAMFIIALNNLAEISEDAAEQAKWREQSKRFADNTRKHLWDAGRQKFIPHIYPNNDSPMPEGFDEMAIHYHGGTTIAIEAGLLSRDEIAVVDAQMVENVRLSGMPSIGLTIYPTYPEGFFPGDMATPYIYQNGGDWTWFGGRMIQQLIANGFVEEAYEQVAPMMDRVLTNKGFYEWYGMGGVPSGSGHFKGSAGVLCRSIAMFRTWAEQQ